MQWTPEYHRPSLIAVSSPVLDLLEQITPENLPKFLFREPPSDLPGFAQQHAYLRETLETQTVSVMDIADSPLPDTVSSMIRTLPNMFFTRDSAVCLSEGAVILRMATQERKDEPKVMESFYRALGIPVLASVPEGLSVEGGDIIFAREDVMFIGYGPRTSIAGVEYIRDLLVHPSETEREIVALRISPERINLDGVLMALSSSLIVADMSALDSQATLYRKQKRTTMDFREYLQQREFDLLEISRSEGYMMATNLVHLGDRHIVAYEHNSETNKQLEQLGFIVHRLPGHYLIKGSGGPRCMTNVIRYPLTKKEQVASGYSENREKKIRHACPLQAEEAGVERVELSAGIK